MWFEVDLEYRKKLRELHSDYPLAPDNKEIKREMLSEYQCASLWKRGTLLETRVKAKKTHSILEFNQSQWSKPYIEFNTQKRLEAEKNNGKDAKTLHKLINNTIYGKTMENFRNRVNVKLLNTKKYYFKCTSKPSYMSQKIFDNNLVAIRKSKLAWKSNKPAYIRMCILKFSNVLMHEFHYDYIKNKYGKKPKPLFTDTDV